MEDREETMDMNKERRDEPNSNPANNLNDNPSSGPRVSNPSSGPACNPSSWSNREPASEPDCASRLAESSDRRTLYERAVQDRSWLHYVVGLAVRWKQNLRYALARRIARWRGAIIGEGVVMSLSLARRANHNLVVGDHVSIHTDRLDFYGPIVIGNHVIIGHDTEIITGSHNIDSPDWEHTFYGLVIEDYAWIAVGVMVLPGCRHIGRGAVVGSGSVVPKDVEPMTVVGGNPARPLRKRQCVHSDLVVESLLGGDYHIYRQTWHRRKRQ